MRRALTLQRFAPAWSPVPRGSRLGSTVRADHFRFAVRRFLWRAWGSAAWGGAGRRVPFGSGQILSPLKLRAGFGELVGLLEAQYHRLFSTSFQNSEDGFLKGEGTSV